MFLNPQFVIQLSDFGLAKVSNAKSTLRTKVGKGTLNWLAPECYEDEDEDGSKKAVERSRDVWAFGMILFEVMTRTVFIFIFIFDYIYIYIFFKFTVIVLKYNLCLYKYIYCLSIDAL